MTWARRASRRDYTSNSPATISQMPRLTHGNRRRTLGIRSDRATFRRGTVMSCSCISLSCVTRPGRFLLTTAVIALTVTLGASGEQQSQPVPTSPFTFRDVGDETGLFPQVGGIRGHAAAWGDVDGSGYPSLFVGTFADAGSKTSLFFRNEKGKFRLDAQEHLRLSSCASGALFIDLDNRGRLDLYVGNNAHGKDGIRATPSALFRNEGDGKFA